MSDWCNLSSTFENKTKQKKVLKWRVLSAISTLMSDTNDGGYYGEPEPN